MLKLISNISIGTLELDNLVHEVQIESSFNELTDTATISIAKNIKVNGRSILDYIQVGMPVNIKLGYQDRGVDKINEEFDGFVVRSPRPTMPIVIDCEDYSYKLKSGSVTETYTDTTLKKVVADIANGVDFEVFDTAVSKLSVTKATPAQILKKIEQIYGLKSFFRGTTLIVGKPYSQNLPEVTYKLQENVIDNSLEYRLKEDVQIQITAVSMNSDNTKEEVKLGDQDGESRTIHFYNTSTEDLKRLGTEALSRLKYDGYRGDLTGFGLPFAKHGYVVRLIDEIYEVRDEKYFIDKTSVSFGPGGYRREVQLGQKAA